MPHPLYGIVEKIFTNNQKESIMKTTNDLNYIKLFNIFTHNINTPLAAIKYSAQGLKDFLPIILDGYTKAKAANLTTENIEIQHFKILYHIINSIESSTDLINKEISGLISSLTSRQGG